MYSTEVCAHSAIFSAEKPFRSIANIIIVSFFFAPFFSPSAKLASSRRLISIANVIHSRPVSSCCFTRRTSLSTSCTNTPSAALAIYGLCQNCRTPAQNEPEEALQTVLYSAVERNVIYAETFFPFAANHKKLSCNNIHHVVQYRSRYSAFIMRHNAAAIST